MQLKIPESRIGHFIFGLKILSRFSWKTAGIAIMAFALIGAIKLRKKVTLETGMLILWIFLTTFPFYLMLKGPDRYYLLALPALAVIAGKGFESLANKKRILALIAVIALVTGLFFYSGSYSATYYVLEGATNHGDEKLTRIQTFIEENLTQEDKLIILSNEFMMRASRLTAEQALERPREQMVVNPNKEEFEKIIANPNNGYYLLIDNISPSKGFWLYSKTEDWKQYLKGLGFEKQDEFNREVRALEMPDSYSIYKKLQ